MLFDDFTFDDFLDNKWHFLNEGPKREARLTVERLWGGFNSPEDLRNKLEEFRRALNALSKKVDLDMQKPEALFQMPEWQNIMTLAKVAAQALKLELESVPNDEE